MGVMPCAQARAALLQALAQSGATGAGPAVEAHLVECPTCRTTLLLLVAGSPPALPAPIVCARCLDDLPAFVDRERAAGAEAAMRLWPQVWWHLWNCGDCLATYDGARILLDAEATGRLKLPAPWRSEHILRLRRAFLRHAFLVAGVAPPRGEGDEGFVIAEGPTPVGRQVTLLVEPRDGQQWAVMVTVAPAPGGTLVMRLGEAIFRASFDAQGTAVVRAVPGALLSGSDGPDLVLSIEDI